uniref:Uncharacterized protein n=1 Tax=Acrobeloides nanus TaxID=290746 RepID=A0A914E7Q8_9BILA
MAKVLYLALLATLLISFATCDESGKSGGSDSSDSSDSGSKPLGKSKENKKHEFGNDIACDEPNPTNTCTSDFTDGLKNLSSSFLNSCQQSNFQQWEQQLESSILVNVQWTVAQRSIQVYYFYQQFAKKNPDIDSVLKYKKIKSYGLNLFLVKDLESVAISFADETIASTIWLDSNNNCNLFDALRSAVTRPQAVEARLPAAQVQQQAAEVRLAVEAHLPRRPAQHQQALAPPQVLLDLAKCQLGHTFAIGTNQCSLQQLLCFYSVQSFYDVSYKYQQSTSISLVFSGDFSTSPLLLALESAYKSALQNQNVQIAEELQAFYDTINAIFISTSDSNQRLKQFSLEYYQFVKDLPEIQQYLDDLPLTVGGSSFGTLSDVIIISSIIVFPQVDSTQIDSLISPSSSWNTTILVQAFYSTYTNWNKTYNFHNYGWGTTQWAVFRSAYLNNNISLIISSTTLSNKQKHNRIFDVLTIFISAYVQQQFFYCIPLGSFGTLADYKKSLKRSPVWNCEVPRECFKDRNDLISIQSDNSTLFTNGWNNFISNLSPADKAQVQQYTNNILNIIYGPVPPGGPDQQISQVVTQIQNCKAAVPGRASDVDNILVGRWGHLKKLQDCQSSATTKQYPSK